MKQKENQEQEQKQHASAHGKGEGEGQGQGGAEDTSLLEYMITHHRWLFCLFFLLPLSVAYDLFWYARNTMNFLLRERAPHKHNERVRNIQDQVREWAQESSKRKMCTARPGWQAMSLRVGKYKKTYKNIKLDLFEILELDTQRMCIRVEPMVTMAQITHLLNPLGWTLPVLPELDDLTVGGLVAGVGVETSSHIHGLFQHICTAFEIVLSDASVVICSKEVNSSLFYAIPWSHGTLGFVVSVELKIVPCCKYVHLQYFPHHSREAAMEQFAMESRRTGTEAHHFVEALVFAPDRFVVMIGDMTNTCEAGKYNPIGLWYKPWFFTHVREFLERGYSSEYIPLRHYYHRHTRSLFWEVQDIIPFGNHPLFRLFLGWAMPPKPSLLKLTQTEQLRRLYEQHHVVQDMLVPLSTLGPSLKVIDDQFGIYPLWLCPFRIPRQIHGSGGLLRQLDAAADELFVDIGAYGTPCSSPSAPFDARRCCRVVEEHVRRVGGYQMMYADSYMTREEFRSMFDHTTYDTLREQMPLCKDAFPEIYDKVSKAART